jgi:hypothetical protein
MPGEAPHPWDVMHRPKRSIHGLSLVHPAASSQRPDEIAFCGSPAKPFWARFWHKRKWLFYLLIKQPVIWCGEGGLEPSRTLRSDGFSYPAMAFAAAHRFRNGVCGLDYPFTLPGLGSGGRVLPIWSLYLPGLTPARLGSGSHRRFTGSPAPPVSRRALKFFR